VPSCPKEALLGLAQVVEEHRSRRRTLEAGIDLLNTKEDPALAHRARAMLASSA